MLRTIKSVILGAYITAILLLFLWLPLVKLHGYRQWWVVLFYATFAVGVIGGSISRWITKRRA